jgi:hypothetical protein
VADDSDGVAVANVWDYYSYNCKANWAAGSLTQAGLDRHYRIQLTIQTWDSNSPSQWELICFPGTSSDAGQNPENCTWPPYGGPYLAWSDMVDGSNQTQASVCVWRSDNTAVTSQCPSAFG